MKKNQFLKPMIKECNHEWSKPVMIKETIKKQVFIKACRKCWIEKRWELIKPKLIKVI